MPSDSSAGASAEVGVRKIDEDGNTVQREGFMQGIDWHRVAAYAIIALSPFGVWKVLELLMSLV